MNKIKGIRYGVILLCVIVLTIISSQKEGYHMDEILAFELSNAEYNPWIVPNQPEGRLAKFNREHIEGDNLLEELENIWNIAMDTIRNGSNSILFTYQADVYDAPVWIENTSFQEYLQVNEKDAFNLFSVYFNVKDDNHPPLHFMLIHLVSSIAQGPITIWHGLIINLVIQFFVLLMIGKVGDRLGFKETTILSSIVLYGLSTGAIMTTLWIRMYGLLALFLLLIYYYHLLAYEKKRISKSLVLVTVLAFWTQYFSLFFILPIAVVFLWILWKEREIACIKSYLLKMVIAALIGVLVYPFAIQDVLFSGRGVEAISQWENGLLDFANRIKEFFVILADNTILHWGLLLVLICLWFVVWMLRKPNCNHKYCLLVLPSLGYFLLAARMSPYFVDRYIMAIFPLMCLLIIAMLSFIGKQSSKIIVAFTGIVIVSSFVVKAGNYGYLYLGYEEQLEVAKEYASYPLVCLYEGYGFYENVMEMQYYEQTLLIKEEELNLLDAQRMSVTENGYILLLKDVSNEELEETISRMLEIFGGTSYEVIWEGGPHLDHIVKVE